MIIVNNDKSKIIIISNTIKKIKEKYNIDVYDLNSFSYYIKIDTDNLEDEEVFSIQRLLSNNNIKYRYES